jgi:hypothetical protein
MNGMTLEELTVIRNQQESWPRSQPGVVGTGVGMDKSGGIPLKIYGNQVSAETRNAIQARLSEVPVAIEETGGGSSKTGVRCTRHRGRELGSPF